MKRELVLKTEFDSGDAYIVLVNGFVQTICRDYSDAEWVAGSYRKMLPRPDVKVRKAIVISGRVFMV